MLEDSAYHLVSNVKQNESLLFFFLVGEDYVKAESSRVEADST